MAKFSPETKAKIKDALRNPIKWWRGAHLPEEELRPWEKGIFFLSEVLRRFMQGFINMRDRLYLGMGEGKIPPNLKSVSDVVNITWDAANDPLIGVHMDRKQYGLRVLRNIMRIDATYHPIVITLLCFNFGLTPVQRVILWTVTGVVSDIVATANQVSFTKIWAGITPHSEQRGQLQLWVTLGRVIGRLFGGIPTVIQGFRHVLGVTDYQIMIFGVLLFAPLTIFARWLPSFSKQRVDFTAKVNAEGESLEEAQEKKMSFRESFAIVKHNRWFIMWTVIWFLRMFTPTTDGMFLFRFLIPDIEFRGKLYGAELLGSIKNLVFEWPAFVLTPLAVRVVKKLKGPVNFFRVDTAVLVFTHITSYFIGYKSMPRLMLTWLLEGIRDVFGNWRDIPHNMIDFEMFDYVEWKTGYRSEGLKASVDGIVNKLIKENLSTVIGNAVEQWTGYKGFDIPAEEQPERFLNSIWPRLHLTVAIGEFITLLCLFWFKYPHDPKEVEADLIERRALAAKLKEEVGAVG